jgi:hypothetical protein
MLNVITSRKKIYFYIQITNVLICFVYLKRTWQNIILYTFEIFFRETYARLRQKKTAKAIAVTGRGGP